ncbi:MAG: hypothetical protein HY308_05795 [Gammaproteobacteria bacterium]|nr:hypothetical protein [Gammaproteobacteria bacterium]
MRKLFVSVMCLLSTIVTGAVFAADTLATNARLSPNQQLVSGDGQYRAIYQGDGNFVVYGPKQALWASGTNGKRGNTLVMQGDGNLVIYDGNRPVWSSGSNRGKPARLVMQNDGNLVIYQEGNKPIWASNTAGGNPVAAMRPAAGTAPLNLSGAKLGTTSGLVGNSGAGLVGNSGAGLNNSSP